MQPSCPVEEEPRTHVETLGFGFDEMSDLQVEQLMRLVSEVSTFSVTSHPRNGHKHLLSLSLYSLLSNSCSFITFKRVSVTRRLQRA